jgi:hypothetical protein
MRSTTKEIKGNLKNLVDNSPTSLEKQDTSDFLLISNKTIYPNGGCLLNYAISEKKYEAATTILDMSGPDILKIPNKDGDTALHELIKQIADSESPEIIENILNVIEKALDKIGETFDTQILNSSKHTILSLAVAEARLEVIRVIPKNRTDLQNSVLKGLHAIIYKLLDKSFIVDTVINNKTGNTIFMEIIVLGDKDLIRTAYKNVVNRNIKNNNGQTASDLLASTGNSEEMTNNTSAYDEPRLGGPELAGNIVEKQNQSLLSESIFELSPDEAREINKRDEKKFRELLTNHYAKCLGYTIFGLLAGLTLSFIALPMIKITFIINHFYLISGISAILGAAVGFSYADIDKPEKLNFDDKIKIKNPENQGQTGRRVEVLYNQYDNNNKTDPGSRGSDILGQ